MLPSHWRARSALKVTLEYAKCNLAAPAQKAQLFSTGVVREVCFGSFNAPVAALLFGVYYFVWQRNSAKHQLGEKELIPNACPCAVAFTC